MASNAEAAYERLKATEGTDEGSGEWFEVTQDLVNQFADVTIDHQFIHVDPEKSAQLSPFKVTIAHGFLTLSMLTHLQGTVKTPYLEAYSGIMMGVNYGFEKVRFISPVKVNSKIRMRRELVAVELKNANTIHLTTKCTVDIEGDDKPACVAEWITRLIYG